MLSHPACTHISHPSQHTYYINQVSYIDVIIYHTDQYHPTCSKIFSPNLHHLKSAMISCKCHNTGWISTTVITNSDSIPSDQRKPKSKKISYEPLNSACIKALQVVISALLCHSRRKSLRPHDMSPIKKVESAHRFPETFLITMKE